MKIVVDENIPIHTADALRALGHDVLDVRGTPDAGISDQELWGHAQRAGALRITTDKGFARRWQEPHHGVVVVRLRRPNRARIHERVLRAMREFAEQQWPGTLVVMRDRAQSVRRSRRRGA
ncbi:hypothetical protein RAS1_12130 [Phycisphaerae bacterium RAS1]|nr:hypothetical protein RAS1_12130 [Phycisphaerae bacterium RAS1]